MLTIGRLAPVLAREDALSQTAWMMSETHAGGADQAIAQAYLSETRIFALLDAVNEETVVEGTPKSRSPIHPSADATMSPQVLRPSTS